MNEIDSYLFIGTYGPHSIS